MTQEAKARVGIDALLDAAGRHVCDLGKAKVEASLRLVTTVLKIIRHGSFSQAKN